MPFQRLSVASLLMLLLTLPLAPTAAPAAAEQSGAPLADAAELAEWKQVEQLLQDGSDPNLAQVDGTTALHWAAWHDHLPAVEQLLRHKVNADAGNRYGITPLWLACTNGNGAMVQRLLEAGAGANTTLAGGETVLMTAARTGRVEPVQALLKHGAEVNSRERRGQTAIMWAAAEGHAAVVSLLLQAGADFQTPLESGFTPLTFAVREGRADVVDVLLAAGADVNATMQPRARGPRSPRPGTSPLLVAVENAHFELALRLLDAGADPNDQRSGYTPLHVLSWVRKPNLGDGVDGDPAPRGSGTVTSLQFVRELVQRGADVNARLHGGRSGRGHLNQRGATPLLLAADTADLLLLRLLIELGADPTISNADRCPPLLAAAGIGTLAPGEEAGTEDEALAAVGLLLDLGADINAVDDNGETAMHGAAYKSLPRMVRLLAERGADVRVWNRRNKYGWTPLMIAEGHRPGNFKPDEATIEAIRDVMLAVGVQPPAERTPRTPPARGEYAPERAPSPQAAPDDRRANPEGRGDDNSGGHGAASHAANAWVKRSPLDDAPVSPRLGYEGACVWDSRQRLLVRYGGHNQGGGGEQGAEVWTFDLRTAGWTLKEPNTSPPGVCCNAQNVYDPASGRYIRFPKFSGSHGWQWARELYLNDSSVWTYDLAANRWRNMRPLPTPRLAGYRAAAWDSHQHLAVVFGGEGSHEGTLIYDPARNEWRWPRPAQEPAPRSGGNLAYDAARRLHILFGSQFTDDPHTWAYDVAANQWRDMRPEVMPPTDKNDAVLTYDPVNQRVLALVKVTTGEGDAERHQVQTWTYDAGANRWTRMHPAAEPDAAGNRTRNLVFAPELNLAILENCTSRPREQQIWTYRLADVAAGGGAAGGESTANERPAPTAAQADAPPLRQPPLVEQLVVSVVAKDRVQLGWQPPAGEVPAGYLVERAVVEVWSDDQLVRLKTNTPPLESPSVGALRRIGAFRQLTSQPLGEPAYTDQAVDLSRPAAVEGEPIYDAALHDEHLDPSGRPYRFGVYAYRVRVVDQAGNIGGPSPAVFTVPSSPEQVFSREGDGGCGLRWAANPEQGIAGYRVYRLDGRWNKDPVSRLTPDPIARTEYEDPTAGQSTRRYYIVAVDALGQEGFPSSPVWYQREWRPYYEPFVGEWHQ
ncbi:MAG: ankyrin repeat domain-containing protein [Pirellulaceae bacterium]|nr:ankyrin repeat domain-containing protein [Pirellulaceae bacterium]